MKDDSGYRAYLAAPLFNDVERTFNLSIEAALLPYIKVFLPQRDGGLLKELVSEGISVREARARIFNGDLRAIADSDLLLAVLDGRTVDEGVAFELGYAR